MSINGEGNITDLDNGHKLQWSKFSPDRSEQYVIRTDNQEEFDTLIKKYKSLIPQPRAFPDDEGKYATSPDQVQAQVQVCLIHNKPFRVGKFGPYCATKMPDGSWCKQKPKEIV